MDSQQFPQYQSKAQVSALQVSEVIVNPQNGGAIIKFTNEGFADVTVNNVFMQKYKPVRGGFVLFDKGFKTYQSQEEFTTNYEVEEELLSPIDETTKAAAEVDVEEEVIDPKAGAGTTEKVEETEEKKETGPEDELLDKKTPPEQTGEETQETGPGPEAGSTGGGVDVNINALSKELSAEDAIEAIKNIKEQEKLESFTVDEDRPTVVEAINEAKARMTNGGG